MKLHNGWIIDNEDPYGKRRIRLRDVAEYAYSESDHTYVWVRSHPMPTEFPGNHVEALDAYFAKHPDT